jgi:hypothetical protein
MPVIGNGAVGDSLVGCEVALLYNVRRIRNREAAYVICDHCVRSDGDGHGLG